MAVTADRVVVELEARLDRYDRRIAGARQRFDRSMTQIRGSAGTTEVRVQRSFDNISRAANIMGGAVLGALGTRAITSYADAWTEAGNKIAAASQISGIGADTLAELTQRAVETRTAFEPYIDLYSRLLRAGGQVNATQEEIAAATDIVAKSFKAGGAAAQEQAAGILQLGQALGSGFLQGDELRSLRENAPLLAQAIADEFNTTIGGLKKLGEEGALVSDRVFRAIIRGQAGIEAAFAKTQSTVGDGFTNLRTALIRFVGDADDAVGATDGLVAALDALAENLEAVALVAGALAARALTPLAVALASRLAVAARTASTALQLLAVQGGAALVATQALRGALALLGGPIGAVVVGATALGGAYLAMRDNAVAAERSTADLIDTSGQLTAAINDVEEAQRAYADAIGDTADAQGTATESIVADTRREFEAKKSLLELEVKRQRALQAERQAAIAASRERIAAAETSLERLPNITPPPGLSRERIAATRQAQSERLAGVVSEVTDEITRLEAESELTAIAIAEAEKAIASGFRDIGGGGGGGARSGAAAAARETADAAEETANAFELEAEAIARRTSEIEHMTEVQAGLNPLVEDYGRAVEAAHAEMALLLAAEEAGLEVTPELAAAIRDLADAYGTAAAAARKQQEEEAKFKRGLAEFKDFSRDTFDGFIQGAIQGAKATDILADAVDKLAQKLYELSLNSLFDTGGGSSGLSGFLSAAGSIIGLFGGASGGPSASAVAGASGGAFLYDQGGATGGRRGRPAGIVHGEEFVVRAGPAQRYRAILEAINERGNLPGFERGGFVGSAPSMDIPTIGRRTAQQSNGGDQYVNVRMEVHGVRDVDGFRRSQGQIESDLQRRLANVARRGTA